MSFMFNICMFFNNNVCTVILIENLPHVDDLFDKLQAVEENFIVGDQLIHLKQKKILIILHQFRKDS